MAVTATFQWVVNDQGTDIYECVTGIQCEEEPYSWSEVIEQPMQEALSRILVSVDGTFTNADLDCEYWITSDDDEEEEYEDCDPLYWNVTKTKDRLEWSNPNDMVLLGGGYGNILSGSMKITVDTRISSHIF